MRYIFDGLGKYGLGEKALSEEDFHRICEAENISVLWSPEKFSFYFNVMDRGFIVLPKRKRGLKLLFSMFHELGHHFLHVGNEPVAMFEGLCHTRDETEADAIALVALMPKHLLNEMAFLDGSRFAHHLFNERIRLNFLYRI